MKKTILYMLCLLTVAAFYSCKDDDLSSGADNRLFRTMFRCDNNTGKETTTRTTVPSSTSMTCTSTGITWMVQRVIISNGHCRVMSAVVGQHGRRPTLSEPSSVTRSFLQVKQIWCLKTSIIRRTIISPSRRCTLWISTILRTPIGMAMAMEGNGLII